MELQLQGLEVNYEIVASDALVQDTLYSIHVDFFH